MLFRLVASLLVVLVLSLLGSLGDQEQTAAIDASPPPNPLKDVRIPH